MHPGLNALVKFQKIQALEALKHKGKQNPYCATLRSIVDLFLLNREKKRHCIVLFGLANSGKSSILDCC